MEVYIPAQCVPKKTIDPFTASDRIIESVKPLLTDDQLPPLLLDKNIPTGVPAKMLDPSTASAVIEGCVKPVLAAVQLLPVSEDKNTPPLVPAKVFTPLNACIC